MNKPSRRELRYAARFPIRFVVNRRHYISMVEDVSFRGMRIRTDAMPSLRLLVRVDLELPDTGQRLSMHAMVAHTTLQDGCSQPSIGLELYGVADEERAAWMAFVKRVRLRTAASDDHGVSYITHVEPKNETELDLLRARAATGSRVFVETSLGLEPGTPVHTAVLHPGNRDKMFLLEGVVTGCVDRPESRGAILDLRRLDGAGLERMTRFNEPPSQPAHSRDPATVRLKKPLRAA